MRSATGDKLFAIGGVGPGTRTTLAYDPATDAWERRAEITTLREHLAAAIVDGWIYAIAGHYVGRNLDVVEIYDPAADSWMTLPPLPTARSGLAAAALGRQIYMLAGGPTAGLSVSAANQAFTP